MYVSDVALLAIVQRSVAFTGEQVRKTQNGVQRSAQLVAHRGEKLILELTGAFRFFLCVHKELFRPLLLGDVSRDFCETAQPPRPVAQGGNHHVGPEPRSVLAHAPAFVFEASSLFGKLQFMARPASFHILRWVEAGEVLADDFLRLVALDAFGPGIPTGSVS